MNHTSRDNIWYYVSRIYNICDSKKINLLLKKCYEL